MSKRRVVITGLGMLSPVGNSVSDSWKNILKGASGVADITKFDTEGFETKFAATVDYDPENYLDKKDIRRKEVFNGTNRMAEYGPFDVILYIGDAMGDFYSLDYHRFGMDQFIFPNPMYGKW